MHSIFGQELTRCTAPQILVRHSKISSRTCSVEREQRRDLRHMTENPRLEIRPSEPEIILLNF